MTAEERAEIRTSRRGLSINEVERLLDALDVCEAERDRAVEMLDRCDRLFYGWSYDDVFSRVERMRLLVRSVTDDLLVATEESNE